MQSQKKQETKVSGMKKSWSKRSVDHKIPRRPLKQIIGQRHHEVPTPNVSFQNAEYFC